MEYLLGNKVLVVPICVWITSQVIKLFINLAVMRTLNLRSALSPGGMPSSHAAIVTSMAVSVGKTVGLDSPLFGVAAVVAVIVMYDAAGVRRAVGIQAGILNKMMDEYFENHSMGDKRLRELIGHTPLQVFVGASLGFVMGSLWG